MTRHAISVGAALDRLSELPLSHLQEAPDSSGKGWFMRLEPKPLAERYKAYPGVYSTSFAIQLLSRQRNPTTDRSRAAIVAGMQYLLTQFSDSRRIDAGERPECKQTRKLQEVGHHDFILTLKLCAVLQATNAVARIMHTHPDFAGFLNRQSALLDEIARQLLQMAVCDTSGKRVELAWPWHRGGETDIIPSCEVLLTLTDRFVGSSRFLKDYQQTVGYLIAALQTDATTLLNKVYACKALLTLTSRVENELIPLDLKTGFATDLEGVVADLSNLPWQEVMHFQVPSTDRGTISHYKPWIWTFPKIEFTQCFAGLAPKAGRRAEFEVAAQLLRNISRNEGKVVFLQSAPPTLLASLKTADFLSNFRHTILSTTLGILSFAKERLLLGATEFLVRHRSVPVIVVFLLLLAALAPNRGTIGGSMVDTPPVTRSLLVLQDCLAQLLLVWPLVCFVFVVLLTINQGSFLARFRASLLNLFVGVIVKVALGFIPAVR